MRKNGIDRTLTPVEGGICAAKGFQASAVRCGFGDKEPIREDFALIVSKRRYPTAFLSCAATNVGAHVTLSEKHVQSGLANAILINGGIANDYGEKAERTAENISRLFANKCNFDRNELVLISTGEWGAELRLSDFERGLPLLSQGLGDTQAHSEGAARALAGTDKEKSFAFSFWIGDTVCKIGGIYSGSVGLQKRAQSTVCLLTTDVRISSKMLQKALKSAINEHFLMLSGRLSSPNDCACIMASGYAENWEITDNNSDYQKFAYALSSVMEYICREIAVDSGKQCLLCRVTGAKSKNIARELAKWLASSSRVKNALTAENFDVQEILRVLLGGGEAVDLDGITVLLRSAQGEVVTFEERRVLRVSRETFSRITSDKEIELIIALKKGNYSATAYGCI